MWGDGTQAEINTEKLGRTIPFLWQQKNKLTYLKKELRQKEYKDLPTALQHLFLVFLTSLLY